MARIVTLPILHEGQLMAQDAHLKHRMIVVRAGRRFGKSVWLQAIMCNLVVRGQYIGLFCPAYKYLSEFYRDAKHILNEEIESSSKTDGVILTKRHGRCDFWSLENQHAGRSRRYHGALIDEAGIAKDNMSEIFNQAIRPTLLDYNGFVIVTGTPLGVKPGSFFYEICNDKNLGFHEIHLPTHTNPHLNESALQKLKEENHPLVYQQEYLAEFVDWRGTRFFDITKMMVNDRCMDMPSKVDYVFAVVDSATKTGKQHDGTAVVFCSFTKNLGHGEYPLIFLDYDIVQIEGDTLNDWLPVVAEMIAHYSSLCNARYTSPGIFIEDKSSGTMLLQHARKKGMRATAIDSKLTALGKDERAISVSGYVWQGKAKLTQNIYDRMVTFKEKKRNHFLEQFFGYMIADPDAATRSDDLADAAIYAIALSLGDKRGF